MVVALLLLATIHLSAAGMVIHGDRPKSTLAVEEPVPEWLIKNVIRWRPLIQRWQPELENLQGVRGEALVMAVMAQESQGFADPSAVWGTPRDRVGSVGLMQVAPIAGRPSAYRLLDPGLNTYWGMRVLNDAIGTQDTLRMAVATYNCWPPDKILGDRCGSKGGLHYADRVLNHFYPVFLYELECPPLEEIERQKEDVGAMPETERECG